MNSFNQLSLNSPTADQQNLERLWQLPPHPQPSDYSLNQGLKRLGKWLLISLTDSQQIRIWTKNTRAGVLWCAYDPITQRSVERCSETDLRAWLEDRYQK